MSDQFQGWIHGNDLTFIYLKLGDDALRAGVLRDKEDQLFHCACGSSFATAEEIQKHGAENTDEMHPVDFRGLFTFS